MFNVKTAKQLTSQNGIYCNRFTHLLLAVLMKTNLCWGRLAARQTDWQTERQTDSQTDWQIDWQTERQTEWQIDWQTERQTEWQTDRQTDREDIWETLLIYNYSSVWIIHREISPNQMTPFASGALSLNQDMPILFRIVLLHVWQR